MAYIVSIKRSLIADLCKTSAYQLCDNDQ